MPSWHAAWQLSHPPTLSVAIDVERHLYTDTASLPAQETFKVSESLSSPEASHSSAWLNHSSPGELRRRQGKGRRPSSDGAGELGPREPEPPRLRLRLYF